MLPIGQRYRGLDAAELHDVLLAEEAELDFPEFGVDDAWSVGCWLRRTAVEQGFGVGVAITLGDQRAFHAATQGAAALNDDWLERKFRVVRLYGHSSLAVRAQYLRDGESFETHSALDPLLYAAAGGGFPLRVRGTLVGAVGVSGLEMHDDHALLVEALRHHIKL
ncbi:MULTISPECIES: heme-degrading domain-containing protein [Arthrobacter]|nr:MULTISPECIES: heme-binding protein [Arthrobacter]MBT8159760.1 heme-binding protein [Arthrobacter sp. GN70]